MFEECHLCFWLEYQRISKKYQKNVKGRVSYSSRLIPPIPSFKMIDKSKPVALSRACAPPLPLTPHCPRVVEAGVLEKCEMGEVWSFPSDWEMLLLFFIQCSRMVNILRCIRQVNKTKCELSVLPEVPVHPVEKPRPRPLRTTSFHTLITGLGVDLRPCFT